MTRFLGEVILQCKTRASALGYGLIKYSNGILPIVLENGPFRVALKATSDALLQARYTRSIDNQ